MKHEETEYQGHRHRFRDRFLKSGLDGLADYEVVELLLTLALPRSDVKQPAKALIARFGKLRGILDAPIEELRAIPGIDSVTPVARPAGSRSAPRRCRALSLTARASTARPIGSTS